MILRYNMFCAYSVIFGYLRTPTFPHLQSIGWKSYVQIIFPSGSDFLSSFSLSVREKIKEILSTNLVSIPGILLPISKKFKSILINRAGSYVTGYRIYRDFSRVSTKLYCNNNINPTKTILLRIFTTTVYYTVILCNIFDLCSIYHNVYPTYRLWNYILIWFVNLVNFKNGVTPFGCI